MVVIIEEHVCLLKILKYAIEVIDLAITLPILTASL